MDSAPFTLSSEELSAADVREVAALSARAYRDDPFFHFLLPNDERREASLIALHQSVYAPAMTHRRCVVARDHSGVILGAALWLAPGGFPLPPMVQLRQARYSWATFRGQRGALRRGVGLQQEVLKKHPRQPHWYLWSLTVDPTVHGRGIGSALVREGLVVADRDGVGVHLETQNRDNLGFYEHFGFQQTYTVVNPAGGPKLYAMWRDPVSN